MSSLKLHEDVEEGVGHVLPELHEDVKDGTEHLLT
jgi:hypothetical protein